MGMGRREKGEFLDGRRARRAGHGCVYDWNLLPIGQVYGSGSSRPTQKFPPMQDPASYNLDQVIAQLRKLPGHPSQ